MKHFISFIITMTTLAVTSLLVTPKLADNNLVLSGEIWANQFNIATDFAGGNGTETNPWQIADASQLAFLAQEVNDNNILINHPEAHFVLMDDILLNDTTGWENWENSAPANEWTPIGFDTFLSENARPFLGNFDGAGFSVRGIYIDNELYDQGLFGFTSGATIKNLTVEESFIRARNHVGGIVGHGFNSTIENATNRATIHLYKTNHSSAFAGGIAGIAHTILNSVNHGIVIAEAMTINTYDTAFVSPVFVGGIVGRIDSRIANSKNTGSVTAFSLTSTGDAGGIVGQNPVSGTIINAINTGSVTADSASTSGRPGGIVGSNAGRVLNSYNAGSVTSTSATRWIGGIAGFHSGAMIENSFWLRTLDLGPPVLTGAGAGGRANIAHFNNNGLFFTGTPLWPNATTVLINDALTKRSNSVFEMLNAWVTNEHLNNRNHDLLFFTRTTEDSSNPLFHDLNFATFEERNVLISDINASFTNDQANSGLVSVPSFDITRAAPFKTELVSTDTILMEITVDTGQYINHVQINGVTISVSDTVPGLFTTTINGLHFRAWWSQFELESPSGIWIELTNVTETVDIVTDINPMIYTITYRSVHTGADNSANPTTFTMFDTVTLADPTGTVLGLVFSHWSFTENGPSITAIALGTTGNREIWAVWITTNYTITYVFNSSTGPLLTGVTNTNPSSFTVASLDITLTNPSLAGYDFDGWFLDVTHLLPVTGVAILEGSTGNRTFYARFVPINYTITYVFNSSTGRTLTGVTNTNPGTFTIESLDITLVNPSLAGYDFNGWFLEAAHLTPVTGVAILEGSIGNRTFYARFTPITYTITYVYSSSTGLTLVGVTNSNPSSFTIESLDITLVNPSLAGYDFDGWFIDATLLTPVTGVAIIEGSTGNRIFYARFTPITYTITYVYSSSTGLTLAGVTNSNPSSFTIESLDITLANPSLAGYDFAGWFLEAAHLTPITGVAILEGSIGNRTFYARFTPITYTITYVYSSSTGLTLVGVTNSNPSSFTIESLNITLVNPSLSGYDFDGWFIDATLLTPVTGVAILEGSTGNRIFYARFTPITYTITYVYSSSTGLTLAGVTNSNPSSFTIESLDITLANPSLAGYDFAGWFLEVAHLTPVTGVAIIEGSTGNITFYARFVPIIYTITYAFNNSTGTTLTGVTNANPSSFTIESLDITLVNPSLAGYDFDGWFLDTTHLLPVTGVAILEGSTGNRIFYARFVPINYTITYVFNSSTGRTLSGVTNTNPETFTIESLDITLANPSLTGYDFAGWFLEVAHLTPVTGVAITEGSIGNRTFYARFTPITYTITYVYNSSTGFTLTGVTNSNLSSFTIESSDITLANPSLASFEFAGWFLEAAHLTPVTGVAILEGSTGNRTFYARFMPIAYTITYVFNSSSGITLTGVTNNNPAGFNAETADITLANPSLAGYDFDGWFLEEAHLTPVTGVAILEGSTGNRTFYGRFMPIAYTITYVFNSSTGRTLTGVTNTNPGTFTIESLDITLVNPSLTGYKFAGWFFNSSERVKGIAIAQGSIGNITFYARFVPIIYTITYVFSSNGTTLTGVTNTNPSTFTIESLDITLVDPARVGFDFVGWFLDSDHLIPVTGIAITEGSIGNITFYAKFVPSTYRITFDVNNGNALVPSSQIVTFDTAYILPTPTKTGHTFAGWYYNTNNIPMTGTWTIANDVTLVASWTANTYTIFYESNRPANATHDIRGTMTNSNHQFGVVSQLSENNFNLVGWTFQGWLTSDNQLITDSSFVAELFDKIDLTYSTIILRASWVINSYQVLFLAEDGITIINTGNTTKEFGSLIESPQAPVIEGKTFVRFEGFIPGQTVSGNHSFRAIYVNDTTNNPAQRFTVIFKNADGTIISQHNNIIEGTTIVSLLPENPTMTGNQFIGWDVFTNVNQTIISNLVLTAVFAEVQMRTIEFVYRDELGNVLIKRVNAPVGTPIATLFPLAPMFAGKSFVGWSGYREGMVVSDDFTLVAEYINSTGQFITINFVCSETNINYTRIVERGTLASLVGWPILQREGFEFLGWYGFTGDELTEDITVTAMWESLGTNNGLNWPVIVSVLSAIWIIAIIILIVIFKRRKRLLTRQAA